MEMLRKKDVLQELAVSLYLLLQFNPDTTALSVVNRVRERAANALRDAEIYTGRIGDSYINEFLSVKPLPFNIDCKDDIIKGDTIRFKEQVFNNKMKPPRQIGIRGVIALVAGLYGTPKKRILDLRVLKSGGVWPLKEGAQIDRTLKIVTRMEVMRAPWEDEMLRDAAKTGANEIRPQIREAKSKILRRN